VSDADPPAPVGFENPATKRAGFSFSRRKSAKHLKPRRKTFIASAYALPMGSHFIYGAPDTILPPHMMGATMADEDLNEKAFDKMQERLEEEHPGEWALFHNGKLVRTFKTEQEAETVAHEKFGDGPYLIEEIQDYEDDDYDDDEDEENDESREKTGAFMVL
jgi:hypothetical protein